MLKRYFEYPININLCLTDTEKSFLNIIGYNCVDWLNVGLLHFLPC